MGHGNQELMVLNHESWCLFTYKGLGDEATKGNPMSLTRLNINCILLGAYESPTPLPGNTWQIPVIPKWKLSWLEKSSRNHRFLIVIVGLQGPTGSHRGWWSNHQRLTQRLASPSGPILFGGDNHGLPGDANQTYGAPFWTNPNVTYSNSWSPYYQKKCIYCNLITFWTAAIHLLRLLAISGGKITLDINLEKRTQHANCIETNKNCGWNGEFSISGCSFSGKKPMHVQEQSETHGKE